MVMIISINIFGEKSCYNNFPGCLQNEYGPSFNNGKNYKSYWKNDLLYNELEPATIFTNGKYKFHDCFIDG